MMNQFLAIDGWSSSNPNLTGKFMDKPGVGRSAFVTRIQGNSIVVRVFSNGFIVATYKFPKGDLPFKSKMHRLAPAEPVIDEYFFNEKPFFIGVRHALFDLACKC